VTGISAKSLYQFGPFCLDAGERVLLRDGRLVPLPAKVFSTLLTLVVSTGHLVEKDVLMKEVWPGEFVEEGNLAQHIFMLRRALGETTGSPKYIETVQRRGYRFVAPVSEPWVDTELAKPRGEGITFRKGTNELLTDRQSIAVLPFKTLGAEIQDEYLGLGIADALITKLSNLKRVTVRPTSAVRNIIKYNPVSAGNDLKVATVVEGTIQKRDDYVRVTVQLVSIPDGTTLWAEKFDDKFTDVFAIEDSISEQVVRALAVKLTFDEQTQLTRRYTENTQAHQAYLRGRYFFEKRTPEGITKGIEYFRLAIKIDPNYALAYAGLADCYGTLGAFDVHSPKEAIPKALQAALKALSIEPNLAEAHAALGRARGFDWDWQGAEKSFKLAIYLNPNYATAHHFYAIYLRGMLRFDESLAECKKAEELEPTSASRKATIGGTLYAARRYDQAIEELCQALVLDPDNPIAHYYLGRTYVQKGMYEEAITEYQKTASLLGNSIEVLAYLGHAYALSGRKGAARKLLAELGRLSSRDYVAYFYKALVYLALDEKEQAFEWLEKAYQEHDLNLGLLAIEPSLDSIRDDPRFLSLLKRTGLQPNLQSCGGDLVTGAPELETGEPANVINTLAILPFSNASNDPNMEYLSDGLTESIINSLSDLPQLRVMARGTVFHYRGIGLDPQEIGSALGVRAVMMGRVQQLGEHLVISAELVDARDGSRIWGDQYHRKASDIFSLQEELASEISKKLRLRLSGEQKERLTKRFMENREAYELYLKGRYSLSKRINEELQTGVEYFQQAVAKDLNYSLAHAGMADCLFLLALFGAERPALVMPPAKAAALNAIQLDETLGEAYASLAQIRFYYDWDWAAAERDYQQAVRLSPTYPTAHQWHGEYLVAMGQMDEGLAELKRARDLDPLSLIINTELGLAFYWGGQYDLAIEQLERAIELEPNFFRAHLHLGMAYERKRMRREAIAELETARRLNENSWTLAGLGHAYAAFGEKREAEKLLDQLLELSRGRYVSSSAIAAVYSGFPNRIDQTLEWLEKAFAERSGLLVWLNVWPIFDGIRSDSRFVDLLTRIGLPTCLANSTETQNVVPANATSPSGVAR
jgi:TolB-like protein/Tfp pilus assembly protein PilF